MASLCGGIDATPDPDLSVEAWLLNEGHIVQVADRVVFHVFEHSVSSAPHALPGFVESFRAFSLRVLTLRSGCRGQCRLCLHITF